MKTVLSDIHEYFLNLWQNPTVQSLLIVLIIIAAAFTASRLLRMLLFRFFKTSSKSLKVDPTRYNFIVNSVSFVIYLAALILVFFSIPGLKALGITLFAGAGFITAVLLFASQQAVANIISGVVIVVSKPFRVNDVIKIGNYRIGRVEDITLRHTVIRDFENRRIIFPNSVINSEVIINSTITDELICNFFELGISYDSDVDRAMEIIREEAMKHPNFMDNRSEKDKQSGLPAVRVRVVGYGDSAVQLRSYMWTKDHGSGFVLKCDLFKSVKQRFDQEGIEIPFPYRTIVFKDKNQAGTPVPDSTNQ